MTGAADWDQLAAVSTAAIQASPVCQDATYGAGTIRVELLKDDDPALELDLEELLCHAVRADLDADPIGDAITVDGTAYVIGELHEADDGWVTLRLQKPDP